MSRKGKLWIIAGVVLLAVVSGIFTLQQTKRQPSDGAAGTTEATKDRRPFRNAVVELTFRSSSFNQGEEFLSATGRRIEYIDAAGAVKSTKAMLQPCGRKPRPRGLR